MAPTQIIDLASRVIGNLVVVFQLVGYFADTRAHDAAKVVVPPFDPLAGFTVVRRPTEIRRVNIGGQAFLKSV